MFSNLAAPPALYHKNGSKFDASLPYDSLNENLCFTNNEKKHAGRSKWGKYKQQERYSKQLMSSMNNGKSVASKSPSKPTLDITNLPEDGWVCSNCQNYNFARRKSCNRCKKVRTCSDE